MTLLLHCAHVANFAVLAYCIMPDHVHLLLEGTSAASDLVTFVSGWKQRVAFALRSESRGRTWQEGFYDRVLRQEDDTLAVAAYIVANPLRAALVESVADHPFAGSGVFSMEQLLEAIRVSPRSIRRG